MNIDKSLSDDIANWLAHGDRTSYPPMTRDAALEAARALLHALRSDKVAMLPDDEAARKELLCAVVSLVIDGTYGDGSISLSDCEAVYRLLSTEVWPTDDFEELDDLRYAIAIRAWAHSLHHAMALQEQQWWSCLPAPEPPPFARLRVVETEAKRSAEHDPIAEAISAPFSEERLFAAVNALHLSIDRDAQGCLADTSQLFDHVLENIPPEASSRFTLLGRLAVLRGVGLRIMTRRSEANAWFGLARGWFLEETGSQEDLAVLEYQKIVVSLEERHFSGVITRARFLEKIFLRMDNEDFALKCRYVVAIALKEMGRLREALAEFHAIAEAAGKNADSNLLLFALVCVAQLNCSLGNTESALALSRELLPTLRAAKRPVLLAKLHWGLANLLRETGKPHEALSAFRAVQSDFRTLESKGEIAALHLILGDILLDLGQDREAENEVRAALPIIEELHLVPEGVAAITLLRESLRRRSIDRGALRRLHGYFEKISP